MTEQSVEDRKKVVSIHQPNFFPWLGFFAKIICSDAFVLLDDAQLPKKGGSWTNRTQIMIGGEPNWMSAPIARNFHGYREIREVEFSEELDWRARIVRVIHGNYRHHDHFEEVIAAIEPAIRNSERNVAAYNLVAIQAVLANLGLGGANLLVASDLNVTSSATERLVDLTKKAGGQVYLSGDGSTEYLEEELFQTCELELRFQNFDHPVYPQKGNQSFVAGLSTLDCLFNVGWKGTRTVLESRQSPS